MVTKRAPDEGQIERFKKVASDLGLAGESDESLDLVMGKLDLKRKPEAKEQKNDK